MHVPGNASRPRQKVKTNHWFVLTSWRGRGKSTDTNGATDASLVATSQNPVINGTPSLGNNNDRILQAVVLITANERIINAPPLQPASPKPETPRAQHGNYNTITTSPTKLAQVGIQ